MIVIDISSDESDFFEERIPNENFLKEKPSVSCVGETSKPKTALKKQEKNQETLMKKTFAQLKKNQKPNECQKFITVHLDENLTEKPYFTNIIDNLKSNKISYNIRDQTIKNTITWSREVQSYLMNDNENLVLNKENKEIEEIALIVECVDIIEKILSKNFVTYIQSIESTLKNKKIVLLIYGVGTYLKCIEDKIKKSKSIPLKYIHLPQISKETIESDLNELQVLNKISHIKIENGLDLSSFIYHLTKAIAQAPYKHELYKSMENENWYMAGENKDTVSIDKNGNGLRKLWLQMLTSFPSVGLEVAEAIASVYPSLIKLINAYEKCSTKEEGEKLLQNIPIRRAVGYITTSRNIGPELSKKIYNHFIITNCDHIL